MVNALTLLQWQHILDPDKNAGVNTEYLTIKDILNGHSEWAGKKAQGGYWAHSGIFEALSDAIWELDEHFNIVFCNAAAMRLCAAGESVVARPINEILPLFTDGKLFEESVTPEEIERGAANLFYFSPEGRYVSVHIHGLVHRRPDACISGYTVITRPGAVSLKDNLGAPVSDVQWHYLYETYPEPIAVISDSRFIYVNAACAELYGAAHKKQLIGKSLFEFALVPYHKVLKKRLEIIANGGRTTPIESRIRRVDGHVRYVRTYSVPIDYAGKKAGQIVISDITEQKRALRALERSEKRFKALFETGRHRHSFGYP